MKIKKKFFNLISKRHTNVESVQKQTNKKKNAKSKTMAPLRTIIIQNRRKQGNGFKDTVLLNIKLK